MGSPQLIKYAVAVRDTDLLLVITVVRGPKTDVYVNWPRDQDDPKWKPHASWHASGQYHNKAYGMKLGHAQMREQPDAQFRGTKNLVATSISLHEVQAINVRCNPQDFTQVFEIPASDLIPGIGRMQLSVDLTAPGALPMVPNSVCPRFQIVRQNVFQDAEPWIAITLFDTHAAYEPHPSPWNQHRRESSPITSPETGEEPN